MFFAAFEQLRRYGVPECDIAAALRLARRILTFDANVFRDNACLLQPLRHNRTACASYVAFPDAAERYVIYVEALWSRLEAESRQVQTKYARLGVSTALDAMRLANESVAAHVVRYRLQQKMQDRLRLWTVGHIEGRVDDVIRDSIAVLFPDEQTEREIDARIIEHLYIIDRLAGKEEPHRSILRIPPVR